VHSFFDSFIEECPAQGIPTFLTNDGAVVATARHSILGITPDAFKARSTSGKILFATLPPTTQAAIRPTINIIGVAESSATA
jgi:hypothetical protein